VTTADENTAASTGIVPSVGSRGDSYDNALAEELLRFAGTSSPAGSNDEEGHANPDEGGVIAHYAEHKERDSDSDKAGVHLWREILRHWQPRPRPNMSVAALSS
jgi:hypothetical protein